MKLKKTIILAASFLGAALTCPAQGTAFTYQGRLNNGGALANGSYDMAFTLYATNVTGSAIAGPVTNTAVAVSNGLFTTTVDLGGAFNGTSNWLQIAVSTNSANVFSTLTPRQRLTPVPYALYSTMAGYATTAGLAASVPPDSITAAMLAPGAASVLGTPNGTATNAVTVNNNGLVGIGTGSATPAAGLQINSGGTEAILPVLFEVQNGIGGYTNISSAIMPAVKNNLLAVAGGGGITLVSLTNPAAPQLLAQSTGNGIFTNLNTPTGLAWAGSNLIVAAQSSSALTIFSCTNPANPVAIAQELNGVGGWNYLSAASGVAVSGNLLAVASAGSSAVTLGDVSTPAAPVLKSTMVNGTFGFTNLGGSFSVALSGNVLAIGAFYSNAVTLVNVADPTNPQKLAELRNGVGGFTNLSGVYAVALSGNLLAVAGVYSSAVTLVDVSNPSNPVKLSEIRDGVGGYSLLEALSVAISGNRLIIGSLGANTVTLVDISNPANPVLMATARNGLNGANYLVSPEGLAFAGTNFVSCASSGAFTIFGVATQSVGLASAGWVGIGTTQPQAALDVEGDVVVENAAHFTASAPQVAIGLNAIAGGYQSAALGDNAVASGTNSLALGGNALASGTYSTALGFYAVASGFDSDAFGTYAQALGQQSAAVGHATSASGDYSVAVGNTAYAQAASAVAVGSGVTASALDSMAFGVNANALAENAAALGYFAAASNTNAMALGCQTSANGQNATALGYFTKANGDNSLAAGYFANATNRGSIILADGTALVAFNSTNNNEFAVRATGGVRLVTAVDGGGNPTAGVKLFPGGTAWATISDQNAKKNFVPVNCAEVLDKLTAVPIQKWNYKWEADSSTPNIGPMAQAFKAAFYPGRDDKSITTLEFDGVELAAIEGLNQKLEAQKTENAALKERLEKLEEFINKRTGGAK
ncbi:MAG TPA: tail fiber domain-containing protein [Verrucomicrobiae bacterium]|nr:tail fiber domain-containing protein [Verrucomicrobiae bacterium]